MTMHHQQPAFFPDRHGTTDQVKDYVKNLIRTAGRDGGYILSTGAVIDDAKPENLKATIDAGREYGTY